MWWTSFTVLAVIFNCQPFFPNPRQIRALVAYQYHNMPNIDHRDMRIQLGDELGYNDDRYPFVDYDDTFNRILVLTRGDAS
jgi:hypothetical protein